MIWFMCVFKNYMAAYESLLKEKKVVCNEKKGKSGRLPILGTYVSGLGVSLDFSSVPSYFSFMYFRFRSVQPN
jgi:hypothetical protein